MAFWDTLQRLAVQNVSKGFLDQLEMWTIPDLTEHNGNQGVQKNTGKMWAVTCQCDFESMFGCRYSALLDLLYFDPVRMSIIDPMHNLFLGTAKHVLKNIWIKKELITSGNFLTYY